VVGIMTGESLHTSWWSHPKSHLIFSVLSKLGDHPDVLFAKLLSRKDTLIHSALWPALLAVACSRDPWQLRGLSASATELLRRVDSGHGAIRATGAAVKEIEVRLLAATREVHTESGRHEMVLETWQSWAARVNCMSLESKKHAKRMLEEAALKLGAPPRSLPWNGKDSNA
jgi:hypothetical protein